MTTQADRTPLFALLGADAISITGNVISMVAIPWFVLQTTGSPTRTGLTAFFNFLPTVLAGFFGGTLVDRLGFKRSSIISDLASGAATALIPLLYATVGLEFWQLLALVFMGALLDAPGTTARSALTPEAAERAGWDIERATGDKAVIERSARLVGAPIAGVLVGLVGATGVLWINAASFLVSALVIWSMVPCDLLPADEEEQPSAGYFAELKIGLHFVWDDRVLRAIVLVVLCTNFIDVATFSVTIPVLADRVYGSAFSLGLMFGASGAGSVIGALLFAKWGKRLSRRKVFAWGFIMISLYYPVIALFPPLWVTTAWMTLVLIGAGPLNPIIHAVEFERIPPKMRGRVMGATYAASWMAMPAGVLVGGFLVEGLGLRTSLIVLGSLYLATTLSILANRSLRDMDRKAPATEPTPRQVGAMGSL